MYLRHIGLQDWKAYVSGRFEFSAPSSRQNVILIGAQNGYGKTSLFEAIVLGLFGRDGLPLIARAPFSGVGEEQLQMSYNEFLAGALHRNALREGRTSMSVELAFDDDEEGPTILRRVWHFTAAGQHKPQDEEIRIYAGKQERPVVPPPNEDRLDYLRAYIAHEFLPHYLAAFFLFDGEHVQALAKRDMSAQVRLGIEGLLGIPVLRELAQDLKAYANNRRSSVGGASDKAFQRVQAELQVLESSHEEAGRKLEHASGEIEALKVQRDSLTRELSGYGGGSQALLQERYEELNRHKRALEELWDKVHELLAERLALAVVGSSLRNRTIERLHREEIREGWEAGRTQGGQGLQRFVSALEQSLTSLLPPLTDEQRIGLVERVRATWDSLWYPPPAGCAEEFRHAYVRGGDRGQARDHLVKVGRMSTEEVADLLGKVNQHEEQKRRLEAEIAQLQGIGPQAEAKMTELRAVTERIDRLNTEIGGHKRELEGLGGQLTAKRQELARLAESRDAAAPAVRRAAAADKVAMMIDAIIAEAVPSQIASVAEAMTEAYRSMAHKTIVKRVEIDADCQVRLLSANGRDVRDMALSAGEQQVFAQALISAVASVSGRDFPIVVDTPLARLDDAHRAGVLRYFTNRPSQVILLSTDTEVVGSYYDIIKSRVMREFHIVHEHDGDIGRSHPEEGYFPENGA
jgi:DNA sulfur modification protein DndD